MVKTTRTLTNSAGLNSVYWSVHLYARFIYTLCESTLLFFCLLIFRNTLCSEEVVTFVNTRMLFWACSTSRAEGYRGKLSSFEHVAFQFTVIHMHKFTHGLLWLSSVSQALRENTYPFLAMIMLKDRKMTVVGRLEGVIQPEDLINQLNFIMEANQTYLMSERLER